MKYETAKNLNNTRFKRLIGVAKPVFDEMVKVLKAEYQVKHARGGRKPKLALKTCFWLLCSTSRNTVLMNK
jgi:hypothetical protein